ncbi:hypothetical protein QBC36DRAFT_311290 [Triangularia setosa]|uniref:NACHT domain-containing protein n=1 Tax=Triangularia setosa TaxID=2587417 RepID=A0AAN7A8G7_9PEZI|nr:hypothetical protein QBC36DRAFT_311290 [Podospora setosa]
MGCTQKGEYSILQANWVLAEITRLAIGNSKAEAALHEIICHEKYSNHCFCIFVDALDGYKDIERHDQADLVDILHEWAPSTRPSIKLCVASRSGPVFQIKFRAETTLYLHDLTWYDMQRFVANQLSKLDEDIRNQISRNFRKKHKESFCELIKFSERLGKTGRLPPTMMSGFSTDFGLDYALYWIGP